MTEIEFLKYMSIITVCTSGGMAVALLLLLLLGTYIFGV